MSDNTVAVKSHSLTTKQKHGYCLGILADSLPYNMYYTYYAVFLTQVVGLQPILSSTVSLIAVLWDAVTDPVIGYFSDRDGTDKRKYMARALFPMAISFTAGFINFGGISNGLKFFFYVLITLCFWLFYTFYCIPYYAVVAEITEDYDERTDIRGVSSLYNVLGVTVGNILPAVIPPVIAKALGNYIGYGATAAIMSAAILIFGALAVKSLSHQHLLKAERPKSDQRAKPMDVFRQFGEIIKLRPFKFFAMFVFFYLCASSMMQSNFVYVIEECFDLDYDKYSIVFIFVLVVTMAICAELSAKVAEKKDRRTSCLIFFSITFTGLIVSRIIGLHEGSVAMLVAQSALMGVSTGTFWTLFYSMAYDFVELDEFVSGQRRESIITSLPQFIQKLGSAIGMWLAGLVLQLSHYDKNLGIHNQLAVTKNGIENISTLIPACLLAISIIGLIVYPLTRERFEALKTALADKKAGREYDTSGIDKLI